MKDLENRAADKLRELLKGIPVIKFKDAELEAPAGRGRTVDILAHATISGRRHSFVCEVKSIGQPRHVRMALPELRDSVARFGKAATPILIAPYLSPEAQALCREQEVGFLDLEGNARLVFDGVFIERLVASKPRAERREIKSLFKPRSALVLRVMLRAPERTWRVAELAEAAGVSFGHISNVRKALLAREWAQVAPEGMSLTKPDALLDAWRDAYEPPAGQRLGFYTTLHGGAFDEAARKTLCAGANDGQAIFASFSAAHWLAPYGRISTQYFYADDTGLKRLRDALNLSEAQKGENVVVALPKDAGIFRDTVEPARGIVCTSPVQTYLDLGVAGERGREAADHLRQEKLRWRH